jgi:hypothetical protein
MPGSKKLLFAIMNLCGCVDRADDGVFLKMCTCGDNGQFDCVAADPPDCSLPTLAPTIRPPKPSFPSCFSGNSSVEVKDTGFVSMRNLQIGDLVCTDNNDQFEPIYSFGHYTPDMVDANVLLIHATDSDNPSTTTSIEISADHLIAIKGQGYVPASTVKVGDTVIYFAEDGVRNDVSMRVTTIEDIKTAGVFAPFTPSDTIIVNGLLASCFITLQPGKSHLFSTVFSSTSFHSLAHAFEFPHRLACHYLSSCPNESYNTVGISTWVAKPLDFARWLLLPTTT